MTRAAVTAVAAAAAVLAAAGCGTEPPTVVPAGDAERGHDLIVEHGCGGCHTIGGVEGADARVGPRLTEFKENRFIVGRLPATPDNVVRWIQEPQDIEPGTIMPDLGVSEQQARDIAAFLYTQ